MDHIVHIRDAEVTSLDAPDGVWVRLVDSAEAPDPRTFEALSQALARWQVALTPHHDWSAHLTSLRDAGLSTLHLHAHMPWRRMLEVASGLDHLRVVVFSQVADVCDELIESAVIAGAALHLTGPGDVDAIWTKVAGRIELRGHDLDEHWTHWQPLDTPLPTADANLVQLLRAGARLPSAARGCATTTSDAAQLVGTPERLARLLAAHGLPVHDAPQAWGGLTPSHLPAPPPSHPLSGRPRVHILIPPIRDAILVHSTLPALARAMEDEADVTVHSAWAAPFNPLALPEGLPDDDTDAREWAQSHLKDWVRGLDLRNATAVVAPGWLWGEVALRHRTMPEDARLIVADLHLLEGIERWKRRHLGEGTRSLGTDWWPSERIHVHSCFPGMARLYWYASVPLRQIHWRPYPTALEPGPDPRGARWVFTGGAHLRDYRTLCEGCPSGGLPVRMYAPRPLRCSNPRIEFRGPAPLRTFYEAIRHARYVVVPIHHHLDRAAGISVIAMARAAGRPVITTATPGNAPHVVDGHDGLLVPPGDSDALGEAMRRLDTDDALLTRLAAASLAHGRTQDVHAWAAAILHGAPFPRPIPNPTTGSSPWTHWAT